MLSMLPDPWQGLELDSFSLKPRGTSSIHPPQKQGDLVEGGGALIPHDHEAYSSEDQAVEEDLLSHPSSDKQVCNRGLDRKVLGRSSGDGRLV